MNPTIVHPVLDPVIKQYLCNKRSLGRQYDTEAWILDSLRRFLVSVGATDIDKAYFEQWCKSQATLNPNTRRHRQRTVRNFCLYRQRTEPKCFVPESNHLPRPRPYMAPVIFSAADVARMLIAAETLVPSSNSPLRPDVMRLAVVLLYTAGLRRGELLQLTLADVDSKHGVLHIRDSKFHKSRMVPISEDALGELRRYLKKRLAPPHSTASASPLLCNYSRGIRAYSGGGLYSGIRAIFKEADVRSVDGRRPRVHDIRHNFAIEALLRWYRQGADVQSNLPRLAMYMGHVSIVSTAYYLKWIPEIAEHASHRFEASFGHLIEGDDK
jgi:integrase